MSTNTLTTSQHDSTNDCGATVIAHKKTFHVSNLTTTTQVDTDSNNNDDTQFVENTIKHNHIIPDIHETTTTNTPVQATNNSRLFQMYFSKSIISLKLRTY